jgi:maltose alpha-D-glucosyltransferase/alpha-amylase
VAVDGDAPAPLLHGTFDEVIRRKAGLGRALAQWMPSRRWYAGKELTVRDLSIESTVPIVHDRYDVALVVVRVSFTEGNDHRYAVPLMQVRDHLASTTQNLHPDAVIARLDDEAVLIDAMVLPEGASVVAGAALSRRAHRGRGATAKGAPRRTGMRSLAADPHDVHVLGIEQSNSSAIIGNRLIAKLVRRLEPAENPDVALPGHLARVGYRNVPGLAATLEVDLAGDAQPATVVIVHDAVSNEGDLWQWMLAELSLSIERRVNIEVPSDDEGDPHISELARLLGRRTAELHTALATTMSGNRGVDPMVPQPFSLLWQRSVLQTLRNGLRATQRAVRTAGRHESPAAAELARLEGATAAVMRPPDEILQRFDALRSRKFDAMRIRVHGDLHLGQILWTGHDVVFIDFEGEPGRPMGERILKRSPLVDVGGLVRSIDYAGRHAADEAAERGMVPGGEIEGLDRWRRRSTRRTQQELVDTYFAEIAQSGLLPTDRADAKLLLDAYVLQKGLYEIRYELANRPRWVGWPLSAVAEMIR